MSDYEIRREGRSLFIVDTSVAPGHPEAGVMLCRVVGDAGAEVVEARARLIVDALSDRARLVEMLRTTTETAWACYRAAALEGDDGREEWRACCAQLNANAFLLDRVSEGST